MSFTYSTSSAARLQTCDPRLRRVFEEVIRVVDCTIICGHRDEESQEEAFRTSHSKVRWPDGPHNKKPSLAVDSGPYPLVWSDREGFTLFAGVVIGVGWGLGIRILWGGDWNRNFRTTDNSFDDLVHFQVEEKT